MSDTFDEDSLDRVDPNGRRRRRGDRCRARSGGAGSTRPRPGTNPSYATPLPMNLAEAVRLQEGSLQSRLRTMQAGVDDATGKGSAAEDLVEQLLLRPFMPLGFGLGKGAVVCSTNPTEQSGAIDRVISCTDSVPLLFAPAHSIYPIEAVAGAVEVTLCLNARKLRTDIERIARVQQMRSRRYMAPVKGSMVRIQAVTVDALSPRGLIIGLPEDPTWKAESIAHALRTIQVELGWPVHIHALYVVGIGCFETLAVDEEAHGRHRIQAICGPQGLHRFTGAVRKSLDRWEPMPSGWTADLSPYLPLEEPVFAYPGLPDVPLLARDDEKRD